MAWTKEYVGVRLDRELLVRVDAIAEGQFGMKVPRSEVIRHALDLGLNALERQLKDKARDKAKAKAKAKDKPKAKPKTKTT